MYNFFLNAHSYWAYVVVILLVYSICKALYGYFTKKVYEVKDNRVFKMGLMSVHIQLLLGVILYFLTPLYQSWNEIGMSGVMKDTYLRRMLVEHFSASLIGIFLITLGWSLHKKGNSTAMFKKIWLYYTLGLVVILSRLPWSNWF